MAKPRSKFKKVKWLFGKEIEIPEEWEITAQGRICQFINGYAYSQSEFREKGYPIIRIQNLTGGKNFVFSDIPLPEKQFAVNGDLLFAWSATFGPFIWHGYKAAFHYHQWKVIPSDEISKIFLYYHFTKIAPTVKQMGQSGLGMFHMTKSGMEKFPIALPPPSEQTKIASILSGVDALIESTQKTIEKTERLKKGLMQKLLTEGISHTKFKKVKWPFGKEIEIPEEWEWSELGKEGNLSSGATPSRNHPEYYKGSIPWVSSGELDYNIIKYTHEAITLLAVRKTNLKIHPKDTFLFAITGLEAKGTRGRCAILGINAATNQSCMAFNESDSLSPKFLFYYFLLFGEKIIFSLAQGTKQQSLNLHLSTKIQIPIPKHKEQEKIVSILSGVDAYIQKNQQHKKKIEKLKKGLMQKLLIGQIRVKV